MNSDEEEVAVTHKSDWIIELQIGLERMRFGQGQYPTETPIDLSGVIVSNSDLGTEVIDPRHCYGL